MKPPSGVQPFDLGTLSSRIDDARSERGLTMAALAAEVGVAASTIRRFRSATDAEADGVLALIAWLGDPPERFMADSPIDGTPLRPAGEGQIRVDMRRVLDAAPGRQIPSRTTIQRLASTALTSERPVASLTRWSEF